MQLPSKLRRVGLLGGSFNPPHVCHLLASVYALDTARLDAVWWLPVHRHAFSKDRQLAPWEHRLALCEAATEGWARIAVSRIEERLEPPSYTIQTVEALRADHPEIDFSWIIGSDLLPELPLWHRWEQLKEELEFLVIARDGSPLELPEGARVSVRHLALPNISSSTVRAELARENLDGVRDMLCERVADYLAAHPGLYR